MYIVNGIAYAGNPEPLLHVENVRPLDGYNLKVRFTDGVQTVVDLSPLLTGQVFTPLKDKTVFDQVYIDNGAPAWCDGEIDIAPEWLYDHGTPVDDLKG
jgi:hypothetical protein